jgi:hypothetical protein
VKSARNEENESQSLKRAEKKHKGQPLTLDILKNDCPTNCIQPTPDEYDGFLTYFLAARLMLSVPGDCVAGNRGADRQG